MNNQLSDGTAISHYRIVSKLGAGGMGEVYLARDTSELDRTLAIKLLPAEVAADPKRMQRFVQEARTVSALNHPNVLTIHEFGQEGETRFIATEHVDGVTLREYVHAHRLKLPEVLELAAQVAAALDAAHEAHVVHRDIKPDNIMVRRRDHIVKVLDFGLAKPFEKLLASAPGVDTEAGTQLQQSPFLDIFPAARVRATLRLMSRSADDRVTREVGLGICQRQGLKAYIVGSIAKFDRNYSLTLEALNGQTGDSLAIVQEEAEGKDEVLKALSRAATELRGKLGESLSSIQKFDAPLEVTTSSLDALKEFALGRDTTDKGQYLKAIEFYRRATEKDPNFASAWGSLAVQYNNTRQPGLAAEYATKAYALRERVSQDERARITFFYYSLVTGELDKSIETQEAYVRNYPRDARGPGNLAARYVQIGQTEKAVAATREALRLNPNATAWYGNLGGHLLRLNRFAEAGEVCRQALEKKLDNSSIRRNLYSLAMVNGDGQAMQEQIAWASGKPDEHIAVDWQTETLSFAGEWRKSQDFSRRSVEMALRNDAKENAAGYTAFQAVRAAWLGQFAEAVALTEAALKIERNWDVLTSAAFALALSGEAAKAQPLIAELEQQFPKDTRVNQLWLPEIKAALELRKGNAQTALDLLESTRRFEPADEFWPQTLRAMAYLKLGKGAEAAAEYRKILDHRGEGARSLLWPLAHLNLARASVLQGDTAQARKNYEAFFALWKDADADLPILIEAKKEYEKLK